MKPATSKGRNIWQIGAKTARRDYADVLLKYGVVLIGPGDVGAWHTERDDTEFGGHQVRLFAEEMNPGDAILLRGGHSQVLAIGLITSEYVYLDCFDDVKGLDLQHARRVRWFKLPEIHAFDRSVFAGPRFGRVSDSAVSEYVLKMLNSPPDRWQTAPLPDLPKEEKYLVTIPDYLQDIVARVQDLAQIMDDGEHFGPPAAEAELVSHCIIPFIEALGWRPELIAVE